MNNCDALQKKKQNKKTGYYRYVKHGTFSILKITGANSHRMNMYYLYCLNGSGRSCLIVVQNV